MLTHVGPPGYRRKAKREQPVLGAHLSWIHEVLEQDEQEPTKQRHTAKRIFVRLKKERGYIGGCTMVKDAVQKWKATPKKVFVPLSHPPGEAQVDFGITQRSLHGLRHGVCFSALLQVPRRLPLLQPSPHGGRPLPTRADHDIPPVPVRQWVISVPKRLRYFLADRPAAVRALTKIFLVAIEQAGHLKPEVRKREKARMASPSCSSTAPALTCARPAHRLGRARAVS